VANLWATQTLAIELEDDLIAAGKWKIELQSGTPINIAINTTNDTEVMLQKLSNEMIVMKNKMGKIVPSFYQPYQYVSRRQHEGKDLQLPPSQQNLSIKATPKK